MSNISNNFEKNKNDIVNKFLLSQSQFNKNISNLYYELSIKHSPQYKIQKAYEEYIKEYKNAEKNKKKKNRERELLKKNKGGKIINEIHYISDHLNYYALDSDFFTNNENNGFFPTSLEEQKIFKTNSTKNSNKTARKMYRNRSTPCFNSLNEYDIDLGNLQNNNNNINLFRKTIILKKPKKLNTNIIKEKTKLPLLSCKILSPAFPEDKTMTHYERMKLYELREKAENKCKLVPFKY